MYTSEKIKEILKDMIDSGEFEKVIQCTQYSSKERKQAKKYYDALKNAEDIKKIPILLNNLKAYMYILHKKNLFFFQNKFLFDFSYFNIITSIRAFYCHNIPYFVVE